MKRQFRFKKAKKIFPSVYTKIRMPTDMINLVEEKGKYMDLKEIKSIQKFMKNWNSKVNKTKEVPFEYYAKRGKKGGVKLIPFDN